MRTVIPSTTSRKPIKLSLLSSLVVCLIKRDYVFLAAMLGREQTSGSCGGGSKFWTRVLAAVDNRLNFSSRPCPTCAFNTNVGS